MQYYKMIIADDEWTIRNGLVGSVDWESLGYQVVADVMDGQDVIDHLQKNQVDVIFTDVQMCQVSGLEVARWAREHRPDVKVVIISGYKEFEYVKEAMDLKVCDYVLKPINPAELEDTFRKIKKELDARRSSLEKDMGALFSYQEDPACIAVLEQEPGLLESVMSGSPEKVKTDYDSWKQVMGRVEEQYIPLLVLHIMETLFRRLDKDGVYLESGYEKKPVLREIRNLKGQELIRRTGEILENITLSIERKKSTASQDVVTRAKEYIEQHLAEDFGVETLAAHLYLNRTYFSKEFKNHTGVSVMDYIIQRRMERAAELIKEGQLPTEKIAGLVGYGDVKYFQRSFKKYTGHTVREYRNLLR